MKKIGMLIATLSFVLGSCKKVETQKGLEYSSGTGGSDAILLIDKMVNKKESNQIIQAGGLNTVTEPESEVYSKANFIMLMDMKREFENFKQQIETGTAPLTDADSLSIMLKKAESDGYILTKKK